MLVDMLRLERTWTIPGSQQLFPHQIAIGAASPSLSGAADRLFALYVAPTCSRMCGPLRKYIFQPPDFKIPPASQLETPLDLPTPEGQPLMQLYGSISIHQSDPLQPGNGSNNVSRAAVQIPTDPKQTDGSQGTGEQDSSKQGKDQGGITSATATTQGVGHQGQQEDLFVHLENDRSTWRGTFAARALAFGSFAAIMSAVFWVAGNKFMHVHGGGGGDYARVDADGGGPQHANTATRQGRHRQQADMVELLARSVQLDELVEEGNGQQGFSHDVNTTGTGRPAAAFQLHARHHT